MAYLDDSRLSCSSVPAFPECACNASYLLQPPYQCKAGDVDHARERMAHQVSSPEYRAFLDFMCPGSRGQPGPPAGSDPAACPRPVFGVYDDHDFGWNNGNKRLPSKQALKNVYLDGLGEPASSPRRSSLTGAEWRYTLNAGLSGREVQVTLMDERYERDPLPCHMRRDWCNKMLQSRPADDNAAVWCKDFLLDDGQTGMGSCCFKDERMKAWCDQPGASSHPLWPVACDPTSDQFGSRALALVANGTGAPDSSSTGSGSSSSGSSAGNGSSSSGSGQVLVEVSGGLWQQQQQAAWPWLLQESPFCDVLGKRQRSWLASSPAASAATRLHVVASGSVLVGALGYVDSQGRTCSGDDIMCYPAAQVNLLHTLANASSGCVVVVTGDFHYSDIKVVMPGPGTPYASALRSSALKRPVYQLMASGMTDSTAQGTTACEGTFYEDLAGLRKLTPPAGSAAGGSRSSVNSTRCAFAPQPAFGMVEVDWQAKVVTLSVRDAAGGRVARGFDGSLLQLSFSLDTCLPL